MLPRKCFENLHAVCYFSAFCVIFTQILFKFFDPKSESFAKYDAFFRRFSINLSYGVRLTAIQRGLKLWKKLYTSKIFLKMSSVRMYTSHPNPLDPSLAII